MRGRKKEENELRIFLFHSVSMYADRNIDFFAAFNERTEGYVLDIEFVFVFISSLLLYEASDSARQIRIVVINCSNAFLYKLNFFFAAEIPLELRLLPRPPQEPQCNKQHFQIDSQYLFIAALLEQVSCTADSSIRTAKHALNGCILGQHRSSLQQNYRRSRRAVGPSLRSSKYFSRNSS